MSTCISRELRGPPVMLKPLDEIFTGYAAVAPLPHALYRTAEAQHLCQAPLFRSVLDLGCGSGEFAKLALRSNVDVGVKAEIASFQPLSAQ
jgi:SAM-dependent methyltransferase